MHNKVYKFIKQKTVYYMKKESNNAKTLLSAGVCKITNDKFSWVMQVDGRTILFQGRDNADYFAEVFTKLGYEIIRDKKWQIEW